MIERTDYASLPPARRAELIYAQARSELSTRLWRAALGDTDRPDSETNPFARGGLSMDSMLGVLNDGGGIAGLPTLPGMRGGEGQTCACAHACTCPCHSGGGQATTAVTGATTALGRYHSAAAIPAAAAVAIPDIALPSGAVTAAAGFGANARYLPLVADAAQATGVPAGTIAAIVDAEAAKNSDGSWNTHSRNPRSSAAGLGQFLSGTWQNLAQTPGTWLNQTAAANGWLDARGRVRPEARAPLLQLRYDPAASIRTVADFARINLDKLENTGIRVRADDETTAKAAYLAHHLGLGDARRFLGDGIDPSRARTLLNAQIGPAAAERQIARTGNATTAHRQWLLGYIDRKVQWDRFTI
ncbi:MAG: peptidoglycan-binding protein [Pseudomonadota bacterium]